MGYVTGKGTFLGTGSQTQITNLVGAPTACRITIADTASSNMSVGTCDGTRQNFVSTNTTPTNTKIMFLKNGAGATLQDVAWTSFGTSGASGTVTFNVTTNSSIGFTLEVWNQKVKPEDELRRLRHFLAVSWSLLLICLLVLTYWGSTQIKNLKSSIAASYPKQSVVVHGIDGKNGANGINGLTIVGPAGSPGTNGINGLSVTAEQVAAAVIQYCSSGNCTGVTGSQGANGTDGRTLQIQVDTSTCQLQQKYEDDDNWTPIAQLAKPCNVESQ